MRLEDTPSYLNFPGEGYQVEYREGIFAGYRWYDSRKIKPLYCFGYGLSYTDFRYESLELSSKYITDKEVVTATVSVTNTGRYTGKEVVELYIHDRQTEIIRPDKELKGFSKIELKPGETGQISFQLDKRSFAYYDVEQKDFMVQSGEFDVLIGSSVEDIHLSQVIHVESTAVRTKHFHNNSTFGEVYNFLPVRDIAIEMMSYFEKESGIDFELGDNVDDFAFRVISDFPLKTLVTFTKGKYSEKNLEQLLKKINAVSEGD